MWRVGLPLISILLTAGFICISDIPLGVPGEWTWPRQSLPAGLLELADRTLQPLMFGLALCAFCRFADCRIERSIGFRALCLSLLVGASWFWLQTVRQAASSPHRELRPLWVLYDQYASGYFYKAAFKIPPTAEFLSNYEARMSEGDVLHEGTHPPGLFLLSRGAIQLSEWSPPLRRLAVSCFTDEEIRLFRTVELASSPPRALTETEFGGLCLLSVLSSAAAALAVLPVYFLARFLGGHRTGWRAACLMMTVPCIAVFVPRSDTIYPFTATLLLLLLTLSLRQRGWSVSSMFAILAAGVCAADLLISLAHLPVLFAAGLTGGMVLLRGSRQERLRLVAIAGVFLATFGILIGIFDWLTDCNLLRVWRYNLANHEGFYDQSPRTWWKWLLVNPLEMCLAAGIPVVVLGFHSGFDSFNEIFASRKTSMPGHISESDWVLGHFLKMSMVLTWAVLWLSGKNMGEAARLWCFVTPWFTVLAASSMDAMAVCRVRKTTAPTDPGQCGSPSFLLSVLITQLIVCLLTTGGVSGYLELAN